MLEPLLFRTWAVLRSVVFLAVLLLICEFTFAEAPGTITFEHTRRGAGEQPVMKSFTNVDKKSAIKVQANQMVRLVDTESEKSLGPDIRLVESGLAFVVTALAIARDGKRIATATGNLDNSAGKVNVWDGTTGELIAAYKGPPYLGTVFSMSFSEDGKSLSIVSGPRGGK